MADTQWQHASPTLSLKLGTPFHVTEKKIFDASHAEPILVLSPKKGAMRASPTLSGVRRMFEGSLSPRQRVASWV